MINSTYILEFRAADEYEGSVNKNEYKNLHSISSAGIIGDQMPSNLKLYGIKHARHWLDMAGSAEECSRGADRRRTDEGPNQAKAHQGA